jgi:GDP-L-fucose synthase
MPVISKKDKIYVAGHRGLVGSAILRQLARRGYSKIIVRERLQLDLTNQKAVQDFFTSVRPEVVFVAAARVGGIFANNTYRADFIYENLQIQNNIIWEAFQNKVHRLIFLGSSCIYPKQASQPLRETSLFTGALEETNQPYAVAKIAGLELVSGLRHQYHCDYFSVMPTNLFGIHDNFHLEHSHVLPALIRKFIEAQEHQNPSVILWGDGTPLREFLSSDDLADALLFLAEDVSFEDMEEKIFRDQKISHLNVGSGYEISIKDLALLIAKKVNYQGEIIFDSSVPNGTLRKLLDSRAIFSLGWKPTESFEFALENVIKWYKNNVKKV